jgi:hypothetical protein
MAKLAGLHYWIGIVSSILVFFVASAAAAQDQDVFDLFLKPQRAKAAQPAELIDRPRSGSQDVHRHEGSDANSIFGLFVPYQAPQVESRRTPPQAAPKKPATPSKPANASLVKPTPRPVLQPRQEARKYNCAQARAIIGKYAFGNVQAKSCDGDVYSFAAERLGKPFLVKISALNGELVEVKKASD